MHDDVDHRDRPRAHGRRDSDAAWEQVVNSLEKTVEELSKIVDILHVAIFGRWDAENNVQVPGVRENIRSLEERIDKMEKRLAAIAKFAVIPATFVVLSAAGAPTKELWPWLMALLKIHVGG